MSELGYRVIIADRNSSPSWREKIAKLKNVLILPVETTSNRTLAYKKVIKELLENTKCDLAIFTQFEKFDITNHFATIIDSSNNSNIIYPLREKSLFKETYPEYMYASETKGNKIMNELYLKLGWRKKEDEVLDVFFGVFAGTRDILGRMLQFDFPNESSLLLLHTALILGETIANPEIKFKYAPTQKENEIVNKKGFTIKRTQQFSMLPDELLGMVGNLSSQELRHMLYNKTS